jgi:putative MATE family efflux protein
METLGTQDERRQLDKTIIKSAVAIFGQMVLQPAQLLLSILVIGHFLSTVDLAGYTVGGNIAAAVTGIFIFMVYVTNSSVGRLFGAGKPQEALRFGVNSIYLAITIGLIVMVGLWWFSLPLVESMSPSDESAVAAQTYLNTLATGLPGELVMMASTGILRGAKKLKTAMSIAATGFVLSIPLNILFVVVLNLGIAGAGAAVSVSWNLGAVLMMVAVFRMSRKHQSKKRPSLSGMTNSFVEGLPILFRSIVLWVTILILLTLMSELGDEALAAFGIVDMIWCFITFAIDAIGETVNSLISNEFGAKKFDKAKNIYNRAQRITFKYVLIMFPFVMIFAFIAPYIFTPDQDVHIYITLGLIEMGLIMFHAGYAFICDSLLIAAKDTVFMAKFTTGSSVIYLACAFTMINFIPRNPLGYVILLSSYDVIFLGSRALMSFFRVRSGKVWEVAKNGE